MTRSESLHRIKHLHEAITHGGLQGLHRLGRVGQEHRRGSRRLAHVAEHVEVLLETVKKNTAKTGVTHSYVSGFLSFRF